MLIAGIDIESSGLDLFKCHIVELAVVIVKANTTRPLYAGSYLLYDGPAMGHEPMPPEVTAVNGITNEHLLNYGAPLQKGLQAALDTLKQFGVEYLVAHNAQGFDRPILERHHEGFKAFRWVDSQADIDWPDQSRRLIHLAAERGFLNPFPHVAISDALTMLRLLAEHDFETVAARAEVPWVKVRAMVDYDNREKAKARRYQFDPIAKHWYRMLKQDKIEQEKAEAPFEVRVLG